MESKVEFKVDGKVDGEVEGELSHAIPLGECRYDFITKQEQK